MRSIYRQMLEFALTFPGPVAIRYPKATAEDVGKIFGRETERRLNWPGPKCSIGAATA